MVPDNVFIGPHLRPLPRCRLIASIKFHRATTMSFKCISSGALVAYSAAHRIACALYDLFYRLGRFMPSSVQHLHTRLWRTCCTKFVLFLGRVLALITRLAFSCSLVADATGHFDALTKMGWLRLKGGNSHKCSGFCSALVITRLLIVFRHDVPLFYWRIVLRYILSIYRCWFNLLRLFSIQHVQSIITFKNWEILNKFNFEN